MFSLRLATSSIELSLWKRLYLELAVGHHANHSASDSGSELEDRSDRVRDDQFVLKSFVSKFHQSIILKVITN